MNCKNGMNARTRGRILEPRLRRDCKHQYNNRGEDKNLLLHLSRRIHKNIDRTRAVNWFATRSPIKLLTAAVFYSTSLDCSTSSVQRPSLVVVAIYYTYTGRTRVWASDGIKYIFVFFFFIIYIPNLLL